MTHDLPVAASLWVALPFIIITAVATAVGGMVVTIRRRWNATLLDYFVALGGGFMLAAVVLEMMPASASMTPHAPLLVLAGYFLIHLVEHTAVRHFHFGEETHPEHVGAGVGLSALVALSIHSFFDGISIASGFVIGPRLGVLLFVAILLHKAPEGFTIASIMLAGGHERRSALLSSVAVGAAGVVGALAMYPLQGLIGEGLAISAGVTMYVAASDLIPEVNRSDNGRVAVMVFIGVLMYYLAESLIESVGLE
ncbi:MAG: ZIP family metal transporter [Dehalococcoidia bacterium]|nr:ZIP family metal transporter [Dehalococcoidia bacterium]MEB2284132.1 ZIP family metal transporter [Myxococcales bacterium]